MVADTTYVLTVKSHGATSLQLLGGPAITSGVRKAAKLPRGAMDYGPKQPN
jgi:hypothetical protein